MSKKRDADKTWVDNLKEGILLFILGLAFIAIPLCETISEGATAIFVYGSIPVGSISLNSAIDPIFTLVILGLGIFSVGYGLVAIIKTSYRRIFLKNKGYWLK